MKWSDFNNIISKTDNAQVFIDLMHTFQPFPHGSKANVEEIPISDSQDIFLQTPIADAPNSIEPKVPVPYRAFFNVKKTIKDRSTIIVSTLYLLRDALPPLDMTLTVTAEEEYILELSGLDSIDYIGCEPTYGAIPTKASKVQKRNRVKHPLEFKLRPEIHARRGFCRFIEQLTNNAWGIRMLCLVPKVALPRHIGSNKFKDSLMILWQRCQTDETQLRVALKVKSKPGEWEWLVGERKSSQHRDTILALSNPDN
ncbi:hypothetical protein QQS21_000913 [Conoideocrella luteorostrata]|uniref:Uncharacterized protein n=1 Tax=Conoideocrella luteorostrata TaxID=1105319 RepID=A0AAJ0CXW5_9HYPO|nr:hypothetical protein QQS21_000913 [Conoideocrella luteorostrata]